MRKSNAWIAALGAAVAISATSARAATVNWTGATDTSWATKSNWSSGSVPTSDDIYFDKGNFNAKFTDNNLTVVFSDQRSNTWKTWIRNCGSSSNRIIFKGSSAAAGLTTGTTNESDTNSRGFHIADNGSNAGAYVRFDTGTFATKSKANIWNLGGVGWVNISVDNGATINSPGNFCLNRGSLSLNSGTVTVGGDLKMGDNNNAELYINGGTVHVGAWLRFESANGAKKIELRGGRLETYIIRNIGGSATKTILFNGGTLFATGVHSSYDLVDSGIVVKVGANGGTINANGKNVAISPSVTEDSSSTGGGMTFCGGGSVTLRNSAGWTGATTVEVGTTLRIPAATDLRGTLVVTAPASIADGIHTLVALTAEGETFADSVISGVVPPEGCILRISPNKKLIEVVKGDLVGHWTGAAGDDDLDNPLNWSDERTPVGYPAYIAVGEASAPLTLAAGGTFAPSSITFPAGSAAVTISGEGSISGITAVTNLSAASHTINAPVRFTSGINVKQNAVAYDTIGNSHVTFAGGAYAAAGKTIDSGYSVAMFGRCYFANTTAWTATEDAAGKRKAVAANSYLYVPFAGNMNNLHVGKGATIDIGNVTHSVSDNRISWRNYGEMIVTNLTFTGSGDRFVSSHQTDGTGTFKFEAVTNSMSGNWFYLGDATEAGNHVFYIGEGGMQFANASGTPCFALGSNYAGNKTTIRPWYSDFTIADRSGGSYSLVLLRNVIFCTDDEKGIGRTITIDARTRGNGDAGTVNLTVSGSGKVKVNSASSVNIQPAVTVTDTATLAIKPDAGLGESAITVNSGATLEIPQSGTVTLGGNLTLASGAALAFKLDGNSETTLAIASGKTFTATAAAIKFAEGSFPEPDKEYTLVSGANLADGDEAKFSLPAGDRGTLSVKDGNLVYKAPSYFYIKIAEGSPSELAVPLAWIYDNTDAGDASDAAGTAAALSEDGANGIAVWQSYCLGLDPQDAASTLLCEAAAGQPSDGKVNIAAKNLNVPAGLSGVAVTAYLDRKNGDGWDLVASAPVSSGSALLAAPAIESGTSFFA